MALFIYVGGLYVLGGVVTGSWTPSGGGEWLWWSSAIALYLITTLQAPFFHRPRDVLANAAISSFMLFTVDLPPLESLGTPLAVFRWVSLTFVILTGACSVLSIALQRVSHEDRTWRGKSKTLSYRLAVSFGTGAVIFTPPALISIVGFHQQHPASMMWLAGIWVLIVTIKPVELLTDAWNVLRRVKIKKDLPEYVGQVTRVDDPNIIRVNLTSRESWKPNRLHRACLPGNRHVDVLPLFVQTQDDQLIGTGLCSERSADESKPVGEVWTASGDHDTAHVIQQLTGNGGSAHLIGFVVEDSNISPIRFEIASTRYVAEGSVVFVRDRDQSIYYQILDAATKEEVFTRNPRGTHIVKASQLGTLTKEGAFYKYGWVPPMNAPVFLPDDASLIPSEAGGQADTFTLGRVPATGMPVTASLTELAEHHAAILGVTGTGKTELVFDLIESHVKAGRKVFCVDCTQEYEPRLKARFHDTALKPLGFDQKALDTLDKLVNAPDFGEFGGYKEKEKLHQWVLDNQEQVARAIDDFMTNESDKIGIFDLPDIANTRATLRATEMYISAIFAWARKNRKQRDLVVVLEEAHTVVPEWNLFRYDKADTDAVVGRMSQIALQGRKYGVGLLLVSQRTALVSKTLLSQCNTCISFAMYDKTGLDYLESVFASEHVRAIPNLGFLQGMAFGKGIRSDRPIIFEIPFDQKKKDASDALNKAKDDGGTERTPDSAAPGESESPNSELNEGDIPI